MKKVESSAILNRVRYKPHPAMLVLSVPYYVVLNVPYTCDPAVSHIKNGVVSDLVELEKTLFDDIVSLHGSFMTEQIFRMLSRELGKPAEEQDLSLAGFIAAIDPTRNCREFLQMWAFLDGAWRKNPVGTPEMFFNQLVGSALTILDATATATATGTTA